VEEEDALVGAVALGGGAEEVDELHEGEVEAEDAVGSVVEGVGEEVIADALLLEEAVAVAAVRHDGVVEALVGVSDDAGILAADVEVFPERAGPVLVLVTPPVKLGLDQ
jgi:hypothetical protein